MTEKEVHKLAFAIGTTLAVESDKTKVAIGEDIANVLMWNKERRKRFLTAIEVYDKKTASRVWDQDIGRR